MGQEGREKVTVFKNNLPPDSEVGGTCVSDNGQ